MAVTYTKVAIGGATTRHLQVCTDGETVELEDTYRGSEGELVFSKDDSVIGMDAVSGSVNTFRLF